MASPSALYPQQLDLTNCDKEPIHLIGHTQQHGALLVTTIKGDTILYKSENLDSFLVVHEVRIDNYRSLLSTAPCKELQLLLSTKEGTKQSVVWTEKKLVLIGAYLKDQFYLELEPLNEKFDLFKHQQELSSVMTSLSTSADIKGMTENAAKGIKDFCGYDRVMVYQFDANWNGQVICEQKEASLESWLGLHYPATDIPQQARALFLKQGTRIVSDVMATPSKVRAVAQHLEEVPLDLSVTELRAVSPIHIEYLVNMKVGATLTAAIVQNGSLWGLIACHHYSPKFVNYFKRQTVQFLTQVFSTQLTLRNANNALDKTHKSSDIRHLLIEQMSSKWNIVEGLTQKEQTLLDITEADGAVILLDNKWGTVGDALSQTQCVTLLDAVKSKTEADFYYSTHLSEDFDFAQEYKEIASGAMIVFLSQSKTDALFYFKREKITKVDWGGNPEKSMIEKDGVRLSPRKSFERWTREETGKSDAWEDYEIAAVKALKNNISQIILEKYNEVKALHTQLKKAYKELETFSYTVSHDLRAPLRGIDGFAQIIKEDYFDTLDEYGKAAIETILKSSSRMNTLIDDIMELSIIAAGETKMERFSMMDVAEDAVALINPQVSYPKTEVELMDGMPDQYGDVRLVNQLMNNILSNAFKYSSKEAKPKIKIGYYEENGSTVFYVSDNGIGIKKEYRDKVFKIFNRLVSEGYEGTGIGLAIAQRVIEKHNGSLWIDGKEGEGSTFYFTLNLKTVA